MPEVRLGILLETYTSSKKKTRLHSTFPRSKRAGGEREFVVDSGASMHMVSEKDLNSAELETMRISRSPTTVMTANGEPEKKRRTTSSNRTFSSKLCFSKKRPQCFHWGNSVRIMGIHTTGPVVKNHISSEMARELIAIYSNYVPFVVPGISASEFLLTYIFIYTFTIFFTRVNIGEQRKQRY